MNAKLKRRGDKVLVKITDVAAKAGVAKSTVSNVLTGRKFVSEELREKVLQACKELDFQPNFCASGLSGGSTHIVALVMEATPDIDVYPFYKDLLLSCMRTASTLGYSLLVYYDSDKTKLMQTLRHGRAPIDGAILLTPDVDDERLSEMENNRTHCVVIGRPTDSSLGYVDIDNKKLIIDVCRKLIAEYGKDIYLLNSGSSLTISQDRASGFYEICSECGIDGSQRVFFSESSSEEYGLALAKKLVKANSVFITANEGLAKGVYAAVEQAGLQVAKDVGVFALGRSIEHGHFDPKLSYAKQNYAEIGRIAVESLIKEIKNGNKSHTLVDSDVVFRNSTSKQ